MYLVLVAHKITFYVMSDFQHLAQTPIVPEVTIFLTFNKRLLNFIIKSFILITCSS